MNYTNPQIPGKFIDFALIYRIIEKINYTKW